MFKDEAKGDTTIDIERPPVLSGGLLALPGSLYENWKSTRIFVNGHTNKVLKHIPQELFRHVGFLPVPENQYDLEYMVGLGFPFAADNGCFVGLDRPRYLRMLDRLALLPRRPLWVTAPDTVGNALETLAKFWEWLPELTRRELPVAFVAQDGLELLTPPWDHFDGLFIGGTTEWKLGQDVVRLIAEARSRKKWVHVGRVVSNRRIRRFVSLNVHSIDSSGFSRFPRAVLAPAVWLLEGLSRQPSLFS